MSFSREGLPKNPYYRLYCAYHDVSGRFTKLQIEQFVSKRNGLLIVDFPFSTMSDTKSDANIAMVEKKSRRQELTS